MPSLTSVRLGRRGPSPATSCSSHISFRSPRTAGPQPRDVLQLTIRLLDQTVEFPGVFTGDLVRRLGRQVAELLLDVLRGLGPDAVAVRVVGAPHERLDAHLVDQLG